MSELYPYCSKCDEKLSSAEKQMNAEAENLFYPICEKCLEKNIRKLKEFVEEFDD